MKKIRIMAVDLGTSQIRAGIFDESGNCLTLARESVRSEKPAPDQFIQRGDDIYASVLRCIRQAAGQPEDGGEVGAVSFTGQMAGFMGVGENWEDITGWSCSLDTRYAPFASRQTEACGDDFMRISGTGNPLFSAKYAWFRHEFPEEARRIRQSTKPTRV